VAELDVAAKLVEESAARIAALLQGKLSAIFEFFLSIFDKF
jgi:hypothetical protein